MNPIYKAAFAEWKANPDRAVYISLNDTAKLIRAQLKAKFPNTKFSVRGSKYAGGCSLRVCWTDGPTDDLVNAVIGGFKGGDFLFTDRAISLPAMQRVCQAYAAKYPDTEMGAAIAAGECGVEEYEGGWKFKGNPCIYRDEIGDGCQYGGDCVLRAMAGRRMLPVAMPVAA